MGLGFAEIRYVRFQAASMRPYPAKGSLKTEIPNAISKTLPTHFPQTAA
jgi:hypothetical protein